MSEENDVLEGEFVEKSSSPVPISGSGESHLAKIADMEADTAIEYFKNRVKVLENITLLAIKSTRMSDWVKMGNKMYCQISGTSRIMRNLGCVFQINKLEKNYSKDSKGQFYKYTATVSISHPAIGSEQNIGSATQKDRFFLANAGNNREMVNESDVEKKAVTNAIGRSARILFGLNDLTEEMVRNNVQGKGEFSTVEYDVDDDVKPEPSEEDVFGNKPYDESSNIADQDKKVNYQPPGGDEGWSEFENQVIGRLGGHAEAVKWLENNTGGGGYKSLSNFANIKSEKQLWFLRKKFKEDCDNGVI